MNDDQFSRPVIIDTPEKAKAFEEAFLKAEEAAKHRKLEPREYDDKPSENFMENFWRGKEKES